MKRRTSRVMGTGAAALLIGCAYALFYRGTGLGIPCPFRALTGMKCPGCGVTRMLVSLMRLDVRGAFGYNAALLCMLPALLAMLIERAVTYVRTGRRRAGRIEHALSWPLVGALLIWGVARNVMGM